MATIIEVLGVADGVVLERQRFRPVYALAFSHYPLYDVPEPPAPVAAAANAKARVVFGAVEARRRGQAAGDEA